MSSITADLAALLGTVNRPGDFFAFGKIEVFAPRLEVEGVGPRPSPRLMAAATRVLDTNVRRTWQVGAESVRIGGKHWPQGPAPQPPSYEREHAKAAALLKAWAAGKRSPDDDAPEKIVYPLEHAYTSAELGFAALKGADAAVAGVLGAASRLRPSLGLCIDRGDRCRRIRRVLPRPSPTLFYSIRDPMPPRGAAS